MIKCAIQHKLIRLFGEAVITLACSSGSPIKRVNIWKLLIILKRILPNLFCRLSCMSSWYFTTRVCVCVCDSAEHLSTRLAYFHWRTDEVYRLPPYFTQLASIALHSYIWGAVFSLSYPPAVTVLILLDSCNRSPTLRSAEETWLERLRWC